MPIVTQTPVPGAKYNYLVPLEAPFFADSLTVSIVATARSNPSIPLNTPTTLVYGVDYFPGLFFRQAASEIGTPVYGAVVFLDPLLAGEVIYTATNVGNGFSVTVPEITELKTILPFNPLSYLWDQVFFSDDLMDIDQPYITDNPVPFTAVNTKIAEIAVALQNPDPKPTVFDFLVHMGDLNNPHSDSAQSIGLNAVPDWPVADPSDLQSTNVNRKFVTPLTIAQTVNQIAPRSSVTRYGIAALNLGLSVLDADDNTKALTAFGLANLIRNNFVANFGGIQNNQRQALAVTPNPIEYPAVWNGVVCYNFRDIVRAVEEFTQLRPLTFSEINYLIYFPHDYTAPDLMLDIDPAFSVDSEADAEL